ncbi:MAG: type II toxin-antitoxin system VapC family toxin [Terriglobales bacterium]|jgi:tRNA(fMet)-specific endonuclease VapC
MEIRYLLDTNVASVAIKGNSTAVDRRFGAARLPHATRLHKMVEDFFLRVAILPWDSDAAQQYGQLRASLEREGQRMGNLDAMIVAHALALGAILVTNDRAFGRIKGLKVEDWSKGSRP